MAEIKVLKEKLMSSPRTQKNEAKMDNKRNKKRFRDSIAKESHYQ